MIATLTILFFILIIVCFIRWPRAGFRVLVITVGVLPTLAFLWLTLYTSYPAKVGWALWLTPIGGPLGCAFIVQLGFGILACMILLATFDETSSKARGARVR